ncbi:MAG TPA: hypothetical protein V6D17_24510 [Candidatus Obscuribacterales bacterium]
MDVIFEGRLSRNVSMKDLLARIATEPTPGIKILRITRVQDDFSGKVLISQSKYVTAASISHSGESGYSALKKLLAVSEGSFAVLRTTQHDTVDLEPMFNIELDTIVNSWPELPESASPVFDERALLDKVFGPGPVQESGSVRPRMENGETSVMNVGKSPAAPLGSEQSWALMQPLIDDQSYPPGTIKLTAENQEALRTTTPYAQRITTTTARALKAVEQKQAERPFWTKWSPSQIIILIVSAIVLIVLSILGFQFLIH